MATDFIVQTESGAMTALHYAPEAGARGVIVVLAHGAGAGQRHPFMVAFARGLAARGADVVTFDFPYMAQKRKVPDRPPVLEACFEQVVGAARRLDASGQCRLFIGGKSMGGRMATHLAAREAGMAAGVIALGYPLHPPGRPDQPRTAHLPSIGIPVLIVQGELDTFGTPAELEPVIRTMRAPVTLHRVAGGDHSLKVRGRAAGDVYAEVLDTIGAWMASTGASL